MLLVLSMVWTTFGQLVLCYCLLKFYFTKYAVLWYYFSRFGKETFRMVKNPFLCMALGEASCSQSNNDAYFKSVASAVALPAKKIF